jgi:hypothetical protein
MIIGLAGYFISSSNQNQSNYRTNWFDNNEKRKQQLEVERQQLEVERQQLDNTLFPSSAALTAFNTAVASYETERLQINEDVSKYNQECAY